MSVAVSSNGAILQARLWYAQRVSAIVLAVCVVVHLATMIYAVRGGLTAAEILSVKANAHYSTVFDGHVDHSCNLSIIEIEERLDPGRFVRVHRSFLVNRDHVAAFRRHGDQGLLELDCTPPFQVPVSRGRVPQVRQLLGI